MKLKSRQERVLSAISDTDRPETLKATYLHPARSARESTVEPVSLTPQGTTHVLFVQMDFTLRITESVTKRPLMPIAFTRLSTISASNARKDST